MLCIVVDQLRTRDVEKLADLDVGQWNQIPSLRQSLFSVGWSVHSANKIVLTECS
jgi:hypothetical protein